MKNNPLLICMTPVRNEAWVLNAFLKTTSLWADHIIIADQQSTDGSREIALLYPKVILIDNDNPNFNEAERQKMLIEKAREIDGDKILFALDADEVLDSRFDRTDDWKLILNSKPGDVFCLKWAQIMPNKKDYYIVENYNPWVFHDNGKEQHQNYVRNIHSMRIPYPIDEKQMYYIDKFRVLHFSDIYPKRNYSKQRFYNFVDYEMNKRSLIKLNRTYLPKREEEKKLLVITEDMIYSKNGFRIFDLIDTELDKFWFDDYIINHVKKFGVVNYKKLDIWDKTILKELNEITKNDPRPFWIRLIHFYLKRTQLFSANILIRGIDKILKLLNI